MRGVKQQIAGFSLGKGRRKVAEMVKPKKKYRPRKGTRIQKCQESSTRQMGR